MTPSSTMGRTSDFFQADAWFGASDPTSCAIGEPHDGPGITQPAYWLSPSQAGRRASRRSTERRSGENPRVPRPDLSPHGRRFRRTAEGSGSFRSTISAGARIGRLVPVDGQGHHEGTHCHHSRAIRAWAICTRMHQPDTGTDRMPGRIRP